MEEDPVLIDILLKQNVDEESAKASRAIDKLAESSEDAWKRSDEALRLQRDVIARLKKELEPLQKAFDKVNVGTNDPKLISEREKLSKTVKSLTAELKGEEAALQEMTTTSDKLAKKSNTLETQMRQVREAMGALSLAGKKDTAEYAEQREKLESLSTAYREVYQTQLQLSKGGANLQGIVSGISALSGMLSAGAGAIGLFNSKSEDFQKLQTQVQSLIAITIGLQQIQNTLHSTSAFRIQTVTKAKQLWAAANTKVAVTLGISTVAAKALMATLTLGLSVAIGAVIAITDKFIARQRTAREEANKLNDTIASNASSQIANYEKLRKTYNRLGDDVKAKEKFILDNQDAFKQLGVSINEVNSADNLFITQTEAFKSAVMARAKATAAMELAAEKYKVAIQKQGKVDDTPDVAPSSYTIGGGVASGTTITNAGNASKKKKMQKEADKAFAEADKLIAQSIGYENAATEELNKASIANAQKLVEGTKAWWEAKKKNSQAQLDALAESAKGSKEWVRLSNEIRIADKAIKQFDIAGSDKKSESAQKKEATAKEKLQKMSVDIQKDIDASVVGAMREGRDKKLAELKADYDARIALIQQRRNEIEKLEKETGVDGSAQRSQLDTLGEVEKKKYDAQVTIVTEGSAKAIQAVWDEINSRFESESQYRLSEIDRFYEEQIEKARENGASQADIDNISLAHKRDVELEKHQIALETIDFETQIEVKRAEIADRNVMLQSSREEKILKIQIAGAQKRLAKLQEIQAAGGDTGQEIAQVTAEIEAMNAALGNSPIKKMQELSGYAQQVLNGVGDFAAGFDEDLGGLFDIVSGAVSGITSLTAGIMSGDPKAIIDGAMQLLDTVGKIIQANKQANAEIQKFNLTLAQQAIDYSLAVIRAIKDIKSETDSIFSDNYTNTLTQGMASYNAAIDKQAQLMRSLGSATVKTGVEKKKFLGITYGTRDVYSNLLKTYPDLINKDGELNRELAESLKKSGNLNEETTQLIDNILSASDAANEAMQSVESELQSLVGSIGQELKKALDDGFAAGTDSAKEMTQNVVKMLRELSTQKLFNAVFGGLFNQLEGRMKDSFAAGGDGDLSDDIAIFMKDYVAGVDDYNRGLAQLREELKKQYGMDPFAIDSAGRQAATKGIAQASQDSIDEFNGRLTFLVMKVTDIIATNAKHVGISREMLLVQRAMLGHLEIIAENSDFLKRLAAIDENIGKMIREGINMKK